MFKSIYTSVVSIMQKDWGWIIHSAINHNISILNYSPLPGNSSVKLNKKLDPPWKGLIHIQIIDVN